MLTNLPKYGVAKVKSPCLTKPRLNILFNDRDGNPRKDSVDDCYPTQVFSPLKHVPLGHHETLLDGPSPNDLGSRRASLKRVKDEKKSLFILVILKLFLPLIAYASCNTIGALIFLSYKNSLRMNKISNSRPKFELFTLFFVAWNQASVSAFQAMLCQSFVE